MKAAAYVLLDVVEEEEVKVDVGLVDVEHGRVEDEAALEGG